MLDYVNHLLPEARYNVTSLDSWESNPYSNVGKIVHVFPLNYTETETLTVKGDNFFGYIPKDELSIYRIDYFFGNKVPRFLPAIMKGNRVTAEIIGYRNGKFILSRKRVMEKALNSLQIGQIVMCTTLSVTKEIVFVDIGAGVNAIIPIQEVSDCEINDVVSLFKDKYSFPVQIIEHSIYANKFVASYKKASTVLRIKKNDRVKGKPTGLTYDGTGVFVEISPTQVGIIDVDDLSVSYEDDGSDLVMFKEYDFIVTRIRLSRDETKATKKNIYSLKLAN